jgi:DnaJ-class molecular chaperone
METCKNCNGDGIVGNGPSPWLKEGAVHGCEVCSGTGQVASGETVPVPEEATPPQDGEEKKDEPVADVPPVDDGVKDESTSTE